jgi:hypothetical protein
MSNSARRVLIFGIYLAALGLVLLVAPNFLLGMFGLPSTSSVILFFIAFVLLGLASATLILFEVVDLLGVIWTGLALRSKKTA